MELDGKRIAVLAADDYEDLELWYPYYRMKEANATVKVVGTVLGADTLRGKRGYLVKIDLRANEVNPDMFDALIIPGGWAPDRLSWCAGTVDFIKKSAAQNKVIAAISYGGWTLIHADVLNGKNVTSIPGIKENMKTAGANWVNEEIVVDGNLVTARSTNELPLFCREIIRILKS